MSKFKIGDKVRLKPYLKENTQYGGLTLLPEMIFSGYKRVIEITPNGSYALQNNAIYYYSEEMLCSDTECITPKDQTKYKVGDRVIMRTNLIDGESYGGIMYISAMYHPIVTIKTVSPWNGKYTIEEAGSVWLYSDEMFKGLADKTDKKYTKFNVGDKVVLKKGLIEGRRYGGDTFVKEMEFTGAATVERVLPSGKYYLKNCVTSITEVNFNYTDEMLEPYKEETTILSLTSPDGSSLIAAKNPVTIDSLDTDSGFYTLKPLDGQVVNELQRVVDDIYETCKKRKSHCEDMSWNNTSTTDTNSSVTIKVNKKKSKIHLNFNNNGT